MFVTKQVSQSRLNAEHAAATWEKQIWADTRNNKTRSKHEQDHTQKMDDFAHNKNGICFDASPFKIEELNATLNKFKRRKAPGPYEQAMELYKELNLENRCRLLEILNNWWINNDGYQNYTHLQKRFHSRRPEL